MRPDDIAQNDARSKDAKARRRMPSDQRRKEFIQKSIKLFAEEGFESSTRELARRLGVTQPLLYRYFPSKRDLISAVYDEVFVSRWQPEWEALIADRSRPLRDRLIEFYNTYTDAIFHPDWIRIYLYSGLKGDDINAQYMKLVVRRILRPIIAEVHHAAGHPARAAKPEEIDLAWITHGGVFYFGVKHVFEKKPPARKSRMIGFAVDGMIDSLTRIFAERC